jgi:phosphate:Na+ symporter
MAGASGSHWPSGWREVHAKGSGVSGHMLLLDLLGGVALLIWAARMVKTGILRAFGERLREAIGRAAGNRWTACGMGILVAAVLQSSTATALLLAGFAERGLVALAPGLAVMLGADIGSTLVVQLLSFNLKQLMPALLVVGVAAFMLASSSTARQLGRVIIGIALMVLSLALIVSASAPLRDNDVLALVLQRLGDDVVLAMLIGAGVTWLIHSSAAMVLLVISLAGAGIIAAPLALALVLGANIGSGLVPVGLSLRSGAGTRRILVGNLAFRTIGAIVASRFVDVAAGWLAWLDADPMRLVANGHTAFNLALAIVFLPLTSRAAHWLEKLLPDAAAPGEKPAAIVHLDVAALDRPEIAIGCATREVMRLADTVEAMLRDAILTFEETDGARRQALHALDNDVDDLQEAIKIYLTRVTRGPLSDKDSRRCFDLILFITNLEHIGDIIDKNLLDLAAKKSRNRLSFSAAGWAEITALHRRVVEQMRLAMVVFVTADPDMARALVAEKDRIRLAERDATESHLQRLREGTLASLETSTLHLDILRDLKRINAHVTSIAYPILEATGELRQSRLRDNPAAEQHAGDARQS